MRPGLLHEGTLSQNTEVKTQSGGATQVMLILNVTEMSWEMTVVLLSHWDSGTPTASVSGSCWPEASVC